MAIAYCLPEAHKGRCLYAGYVADVADLHRRPFKMQILGPAKHSAFSANAAALKQHVNAEVNMSHLCIVNTY